MRWDSVAGLGYVIPNDRFFVRDHTGTPIIDASDLAAQRLRHRAQGRARLRRAPSPSRSTPLRALPEKTVYSFIECAGNGRSFFGTQQGTPAAGTQWGLGAVGVAAWTGVPLSTVLDRARDPARPRST